MLRCIFIGKRRVVTQCAFIKPRDSFKMTFLFLPFMHVTKFKSFKNNSNKYVFAFVSCELFKPSLGIQKFLKFNCTDGKEEAVWIHTQCHTRGCKMSYINK